jgi:predicted ATPase
VDPTNETYGFRHGRYQKAAYERVAPQDRADLHERYASWLEQQLDLAEALQTSDPVRAMGL